MSLHCPSCGYENFEPELDDLFLGSPCPECDTATLERPEDDVDESFYEED